MRKIIGAAFVSLDGVMQAPGGPSEDWTGGFTHGGWLPALFDDATGETIDAVFKQPFDLLLGRKTYDIFAAYWPYAEGDSKAMGEMFDRIGKYVVTRGHATLDWQTSYRVADIKALADLKQSDGPDLVIQGSSTLYPQLLSAGLIDRLTLMTFPLVLGHGKRLFGTGSPARTMKMVDHRISPRGTLIATYEPAGPVEHGSFDGPEPSARERERQERMKREDAAN
jgi:dihydrofolate reductase